MNFRGHRLRGAGFLLLMAVLAHPESARAQRSAGASATLRFEILPAHYVLNTAPLSAPPDGKVTVSVEPPLRAGEDPSGVRQPHILLPPGSTLVRPPRGSLLIVTVTD